MHSQWSYFSAKQILQEFKKGTITSRALLEHYVSRIEKLNPGINSVVAMDISAARARADAADKAREEGVSWGPLHGLPVTVKDTYEVVGMPCTAGSPSLRNHNPTKDAVAIDSLRSAGAIIFAKTNVPLFASDIQSFNKVYGTSHNPWNSECTPGGSSGGAAASLAAGFTPLELGSDIGGSIRTPAHFCGVYGHKSSHGIISLRGHIPGPPGVLSETDMAVVGPMARTADDLGLMLDTLVGPSPLMEPAWKVKLAAAKQRKLSDFKVLLWLEDPLCPIEGEMSNCYQQLAQLLREQGLDVTLGQPLGMGLDCFYPTYMNLLGSVMGASLKKAQRLMLGAAAPVLGKIGKKFNTPISLDSFLKGASQSHVSWAATNEKRYRIREKFIQVFDQYDVILSPVAMTTAFKHNQEKELILRKLKVDGQIRNYPDLFMWIAPATMMGLPATSAPVGFTGSGLPINIQIMGAPYADKTTIKFASLLEKVTGGFKIPPGFEQ